MTQRNMELATVRMHIASIQGLLSRDVDEGDDILSVEEVNAVDAALQLLRNKAAELDHTEWRQHPSAPGYEYRMNENGHPEMRPIGKVSR